MVPTSSLRRGSVLLETVLVTPLIVLIGLGLVQFLLLIEIDWALDQAAEAACRAAIVSDGAHPDPAVAAQMIMAPVTGTSLVLGQPSLPTNGLPGLIARYGASVVKTRVDTTVTGTRAQATVTHAAELRIPLIDRLMIPDEGFFNGIKRRILNRERGDWIENLSLISGRPHLKIEKTIAIDYGS